MQSTQSIFRSTLRRSIPLLRRPYSATPGSSSTPTTSPGTSSSSSESHPIPNSASPSSSANSPTSPSSSSSTSTPSSSTPSSSESKQAKIPSTSSTQEYIRSSGIQGFLPRESFENVERWLGGQWERLEGELKSNQTLKTLAASRARSDEPLDIVTLLSETARDPACSVAFNSASLILNTSFFLEKLTRTGEEQGVSASSAIPAAMAHLQDQLVGRARGMVGGGFLWLVKMRAGQGSKTFRYEIVSTHAAGTLLVRNRLMMGRESTIDLFRPPTTETSSKPTGETATSSSSTGGFSSPSSNNNNASSTSNIDPDHLRVTPLACVSLFEHVYMPKYGVNGKEDYVRDWIKFLDWKSIEKA